MRVRAPLDGEETLRQAGFIEPERAARAAAAEIGERLEHVLGEVLEERRVAHVRAGRDEAQAHVPAAAVVGVVAGEEVERGRDGHVVDIALAARDDLEAGAIGPDADDAAAAHW